MHEGPSRVAVVGDSGAVAAALAGTDAAVRRGDVPALLATEPDLLVAVGERACLDAGRAGSDVPILPVDAGPGFGSVPADAVDRAVDHALTDLETRSVPVLDVECDGDTLGRALADVTLVSAEVAHISEFRVTAGGASLSQFRADGVVVATPAGSRGYARRLDGPVLAPAADVLAVVPIAPFAIDPDQWVVPLDGLSVTVARDETEVSVLADDRTVATITQGDTATMRRGGTARFALVPERSSAGE